MNQFLAKSTLARMSTTAGVAIAVSPVYFTGQLAFIITGAVLTLITPLLPFYNKNALRKNNLSRIEVVEEKKENKRDEIAHVVEQLAPTSPYQNPNNPKEILWDQLIYDLDAVTKKETTLLLRSLSSLMEEIEHDNTTSVETRYTINSVITSKLLPLLHYYSLLTPKEKKASSPETGMLRDNIVLLNREIKNKRAELQENKKARFFSQAQYVNDASSSHKDGTLSLDKNKKKS
jgi:hypothetical protein